MPIALYALLLYAYHFVPGPLGPLGPGPTRAWAHLGLGQLMRISCRGRLHISNQSFCKVSCISCWWRSSLPPLSSSYPSCISQWTGSALISLCLMPGGWLKCNTWSTGARTNIAFAIMPSLHGKSWELILLKDWIVCYWFKSIQVIYVI